VTHEEMDWAQEAEWGSAIHLQRKSQGIWNGERNLGRKAIAAAAIGFGAAIVARQLARHARAIDFRDKVVLITGGSRGLGFVLARQLAAEGARLVLVARTADDLESAAARLRELGADVLPIACDVGDRAQAENAIRRAIEHFGRLDVLINNAGVIQVGPVQHMQYEDFQQAMAVHFWGPLHLMMAAIPSMSARGGGRIVNISSIGGRVAVPHLAPYSASKFALVGLSESLAAELSRQGIIVTTVSPGLMRTGSPLRAGMKGNHEAENTWFTISDSLPIVAINAERAAAKIIDACRYGDTELTITPQAKLAVAAHGVAPGLTTRLMTMVNWLLPAPVGPEGNLVKEGRESQTRLTRSPLTLLTRRAAERNNERVRASTE
jgi:NAD(P)-dependent dehydrogenase (short-subunit alcohol dehydrogenase family)